MKHFLFCKNKIAKPTKTEVQCPKDPISVKEGFPKFEPSYSARELIGEKELDKNLLPQEPWYPSNLIEVIKKIIISKVEQKTHPKFSFKLTRKAAEIH